MPASDPPHSHPQVVVLGAGLAGMSAALTLRELGARFRIFEKLPTPGGHAVTLEEGGYRFDRTGHLLHLRDPEMTRRVLGWIGEDHEVVQRRSVIWSNGVYTRYPFQANTYGLPPSVANECLLGFLRAHFAAEKPEPRSFLDFCRIHFGEGISRHFMVPYNARLWGVPPSEITSAWCERFVPLPRLEDVVAGAVGLNDRELGYNTSFVYPRRGIGVLSEAMAAEVGSVELDRAPTAIDARAREVRFGSDVVGYDVLINTAPLPVLVSLLADAPGAVREAAGQLRCTHLYYLDVALDVPCGQPIHWIYVPEEKYPFYRVGCYSHFSSEMAPPGKAGLYVELADRRKPDLDTLLPEVARHLVEMRILGDAREVSFARLRRIDHAYVIFDHSYYDAVETIMGFLDEVGIVSVGRYGSWTYSSMEDALVQGRDGARRALGRLP